MNINFNICAYFLVLVLTVAATKTKKHCQQCMPVQDCKALDGMSRAQQQQWFEEYSCQTSQEADDEELSFLYGFAPFAKGDYVCCPSSSEQSNRKPNNGNENTEQSRPSNWNNQGSNSNGARPGFENKFGNNNNRPGFGNTNNAGSNQNRPGSGNSWNQRPNNNNNNQQNGNNFNNNQRPNDNWNNGGSIFESLNRPGSNTFGNNRRPNTHDNLNQGFQNQNTRRPNNFDSQTRRPDQAFQTENPYFMGRTTTRRPNNIGSGGNRRTDNAGLTNMEGQCQALTSIPPTMDSGCCGRDATDEQDRIIATQRPKTFTPAPTTQFPWYPNNFNSAPSSRPSWFPSFNFFSSPDESNPRVKRNNVNQSEVVNITLDNRIAGGKATTIGQFPWLVLLKSVFDHGDELQAFNCGGSLISATYVLTAGHCVYDAEAKLSDVEITMAEYDKRTFPNDCANDEEGRRCIKNVRARASEVIMHPEYDDNQLQNDIALIRLRSRAPYTEFIRPICLPPINIDNPQFSNLPLHVAGWGRNGVYNSDVKQTTIVNLVPQRDCKRSYSFLTRRHVCAAGYSGEDTCKGDSGGPLMLFYEGKYFVSGVVSGKRADAPCGTSVPSLYTNVYHYLDWIKRNIRS